MAVSTSLGIVYAIASAIFNGSFTTLFKTKKMVDLSIHPMIFQLYVSWGTFISSWFVLPFVMASPSNNNMFMNSFNPMGIIAGSLFVLAISASFLAVDCIGIALAQGIWGGVAMVISYIWGVYVFNETPSNLGLSTFSICLLVVGVFLIAFSEKIGKVIIAIRRNSFGATTISESEPFVLPNQNEEGIQTSKYFLGVLWACAVGIFGGSILVPMHYVPQQGLIFLPSFGWGAFLTSPIVLLLHILFYKEVPILHWRSALITGMTSGVIYNAGNALSIVAISSIGYGVAYPILQCSVLVSGLWGIYLFKEITDNHSIAIFFTGGLTLLLGGLLLAVSK